MSFGKWWDEDGRFYDPDTSDVPWYDKREELAEHAYEAGIAAGMARAGNYTADSAVYPKQVTFANGRCVRVAVSYDGMSPYLTVEQMTTGRVM